MDNLPNFIVENFATGLTSVEKHGSVKPEIAKSWEIKDSGKTYVFHLKKDIKMSDGTPITSDEINYKFSDVTIEKPDEHTIVFKLKEAYAPFLVTVSRPVLHGGYVGVGEYKIDEIKLNGNFVQSLTMVKVDDKFDIKTYEFYPSTQALKYAYVLGEVDEITGIEYPEFNNIQFIDFPNSTVDKKVNYSKLVTLFYNNNDDVLSDKKVRIALSYALPHEFPEGQDSYLPYPSDSIYYNKDIEQKTQNYEHAQLLLDAANSSSESAKTDKINLSIKTLSKYKAAAEEVAKSFTKLNIETKIEEVDKVPSDFQIYLGDFHLSDDPDQYMLWHSDQNRNITQYKNLRIDKLLEDGRNTTDVDDRIKLYYDFQKFLMEDVPASFLYFPIEYQITRK